MMRSVTPVTVPDRVARRLAISADQTHFDVRGFHLGDAHMRAKLERHGASFVAGYNTALVADSLQALSRRLAEQPPAEVGFAYEGAAMALALRDLLTAGTPRGPGKRLQALLNGPGRPHVYMVHVGAGWALARLRLRPRRRLSTLDPFLRWLALDGYGFHEAFFAPRRSVTGQRVPRRLTGYQRRAFDQGVGRALWFVQCGEVERAVSSLQRFPSSRQTDLWSGLALAAAYTASATPEHLRRLRAAAAGPSQLASVAQGAAFAITARHQAGNLLDETRDAALVLCGRDPGQVASAVHDARRGLSADPAGRGYQLWRDRIGDRLSHRERYAAA